MEPHVPTRLDLSRCRTRSISNVGTIASAAPTITGRSTRLICSNVLDISITTLLPVAGHVSYTDEDVGLRLFASAFRATVLSECEQSLQVLLALSAQHIEVLCRETPCRAVATARHVAPPSSSVVPNVWRSAYTRAPWDPGLTSVQSFDYVLGYVPDSLRCGAGFPAQSSECQR
jgi:hypothetical protein